MKTLLWLPLACLAGFLVGTWGAHDELRSYRESVKEKNTKASRKASGFDTFATLVKIPETARRPRRSKRAAVKTAGKETSAAADADGALKNARTADVRPSGNADGAGPAPAGERRFTPEDLRVRIEEAQELWRTRVDVARAQWKDKLGLSGETEKVFDDALQEMNERLYDCVAEVAELLSGSEEMTPELGLRLVGETTAIMAETYDRIGGAVPPEIRREVSSMQIVDFVDPGVAEPLIDVQGKLETFARGAGGRR